MFHIKSLSTYGNCDNHPGDGIIISYGYRKKTWKISSNLSGRYLLDRYSNSLIPTSLQGQYRWCEQRVLENASEEVVWDDIAIWSNRVCKCIDRFYRADAQHGFKGFNFRFKSKAIRQSRYSLIANILLESLICNSEKSLSLTILNPSHS